MAHRDSSYFGFIEAGVSAPAIFTIVLAPHKMRIFTLNKPRDDEVIPFSFPAFCLIDWCFCCCLDWRAGKKGWKRCFGVSEGDVSVTKIKGIAYDRLFLKISLMH